MTGGGAGRSALEKFDDELFEFGLKYFNAEFGAFMEATTEELLSSLGHSIRETGWLAIRYGPLDFGGWITHELWEGSQTSRPPAASMGQPGVPGYVPAYFP